MTINSTSHIVTGRMVHQPATRFNSESTPPGPDSRRSIGQRLLPCSSSVAPFGTRHDPSPLPITSTSRMRSPAGPTGCGRRRFRDFLKLVGQPGSFRSAGGLPDPAFFGRHVAGCRCEIMADPVRRNLACSTWSWASIALCVDRSPPTSGNWAMRTQPSQPHHHHRLTAGDRSGWPDFVKSG